METPVPSHADMYRNFAKFGHVVFEMFELTDKQPDKETYRHEYRSALHLSPELSGHTVIHSEN